MGANSLKATGADWDTQASLGVINDSWEIIPLTEPGRDRECLSPGRGLAIDLLSLAVTLGGTVLLLFSEPGFSGRGKHGIGGDARLRGNGDKFSRETMMSAALWNLVVVM